MDRYRRIVVRVDRSPLNARKWNLELECGHEVWVFGKRRPTVYAETCERCRKADEEKPDA